MIVTVRVFLLSKSGKSTRDEKRKKKKNRFIDAKVNSNYKLFQQSVKNVIEVNFHWELI